MARYIATSGVAQQFFSAGVTGVGQGDADAGRREQLLAGDPHRFLQHADQAARGGDHVLRIIDIGDQDRELVTAEPRHGVVGAQGPADARADFLEQFVADQMTDAVVDDLEAVEVEEQHREQPRRIAPEARQRVSEAIEQQRAIRQAGERIVQGFVLQPQLDLLAHLDLVAQFAVGVREFAGALVDPALEIGIGATQGILCMLALQRQRDVVRDEAQDLLVARAVDHVLLVTLHHHHAEHPGLAAQGHAQPACSGRAD